MKKENESKSELEKENMKLLAKRHLKRWMTYVAIQGLCIKQGIYEDDGTFVDLGTMWDIDHVHPDAVFQMTDEDIRYVQRDIKYRLYADYFPMDGFGQRIIFEYHPVYYWYYIDHINSHSPRFLSKLNNELRDDLFKDPEMFMDWANSTYPHSFSDAQEYATCYSYSTFWHCYTYDPNLTEDSVLSIMHEYREKCLKDLIE
jgi:hypothetical protein